MTAALRHPFALFMLLLTAAVMLPGCGRTIHAAYKMADRPTLVLVDDPKRLMANPNQRLYLADQIGREMIANGVVKKVISVQKLGILQQKLGAEFDRTPIDRIGRELNAEQVLHVEIVMLQMQSEPTVYRPISTMHVKLIDAVAGVRLFPRGDYVLAGQPSGAYHVVPSKLSFRVDEAASPSMSAAMDQKMLLRIARDVGRLFYSRDHYIPTEDTFE